MQVNGVCTGAKRAAMGPTIISSLSADLLKSVTMGMTGWYTGHSFQWGAASSAVAVGYSDYEIQLLGCWCSDTYLLYIDICTP